MIRSLNEPMQCTDLVTNLTKLSLNLDKSGPEVDTIIKQTTPPPPDNFSKEETWDSYTLTAQNFKGEELDRE